MSKISPNIIGNFITSMQNLAYKVIRIRGDVIYDLQLVVVPNFLVKLRQNVKIKTDKYATLSL